MKIKFIILEELIQPCRVELEKISFDGDNCSASAFGSQVHESSFNMKGNAVKETHVCPKDIEKQPNKKCKSANMKFNQCNLCQIIFKSYYTLNNHIKKNHHVRVRCRSRFCGIYFFTEAERQQHEEEVHGNKVHKCIYCGTLFSKGSDKLYEHIKKKHKEAIKCEYKYHCPNYFHTKSQLDEHILKVHIGTLSHADQVQCIYCGKIMNDKYHLHSHTHDVHAAIRIKCRFLGCATYFLSQIDSDEHYRLQHQPGESLKRWKCPKCTYRTTLKHSLLLHIQRIHRKATLKCPKCPKTFSVQLNYKAHLRSYHGERCTCEHCGKILQRRSLLHHIRRCMLSFFK
jgi:KRAB domain-containing zinc finger protein